MSAVTYFGETQVLTLEVGNSRIFYVPGLISIQVGENMESFSSLFG